MVRSFLFETIFHKYKYKIYEIKTEEKTFYDVLKYRKKGFLWINVENILNKQHHFYLRFNNYNDVINYVFLE